MLSGPQPPPPGFPQPSLSNSGQVNNSAAGQPNAFAPSGMNRAEQDMLDLWNGRYNAYGRWGPNPGQSKKSLGSEYGYLKMVDNANFVPHPRPRPLAPSQLILEDHFDLLPKLFTSVLARGCGNSDVQKRTYVRNLPQSEKEIFTNLVMSKVIDEQSMAETARRNLFAKDYKQRVKDGQLTITYAQFQAANGHAQPTQPQPGHGQPLIGNDQPHPQLGQPQPGYGQPPRQGLRNPPVGGTNTRPHGSTQGTQPGVPTSFGPAGYRPPASQQNFGQGLKAQDLQGEAFLTRSLPTFRTFEAQDL